MRLEQLEQIVEINQCHSVSQAAQKLFMTQPALSRSVARLEEELGVAIFRRLSHGVELSEAGKRVIKQAEHILMEVEDLQKIAKKDQSLHGHVHLALSPIFYELLAADLLLDFRRRFEHAQLIVVERPVMSIIEDVAKGRCDFGLTGGRREEDEWTQRRLEEQHLAYEVFAGGGFSLFVRKDHPLAERRQMTLDEISTMDLVFWAEIEQVLKKMGYPLQTKPMKVFDRQTLKHIVAQSDLATIMPSMLGMKDDFAQEHLQEITIAGSEGMYTSTYLVYPADLPLSRLTEEVMAMVRQMYEQYQPTEPEQ